MTRDIAFEQWANKVWNYGAGLGTEVSLKDFRKDITLELYNEAGQKVIAYNIFRCWVSEYETLPDLDANAAAIAIQHIKLENEGWERDLAVVEPTEPSFNKPPSWGRAAEGKGMSTASGIVKLVKGGFVQLDAANAKPKIIVFQYKPRDTGPAADRRRSGSAGCSHPGAGRRGWGRSSGCAGGGSDTAISPT